MKDFNAKSREAYNEKAHDYDNTPEGRFTRKFKDILHENVIVKDNDSVLDVACGNGTFLAEISKKKHITGYGVDIAEEMIKVSSRKYPSLIFKVSGCEKIPFDDGIMDIITVCAAYHHFPDVDSFAKEAERLLKPNGTLYIAEVYYPAFFRMIFNPFIPLSKAGDVKFYSPKEIIKTFTKRKFISDGVIKSEHIQLVKLRRSQTKKIWRKLFYEKT